MAMPSRPLVLPPTGLMVSAAPIGWKSLLNPCVLAVQYPLQIDPGPGAQRAVMMPEMTPSLWPVGPSHPWLSRFFITYCCR